MIIKRESVEFLDGKGNTLQIRQIDDGISISISDDCFFETECSVDAETIIKEFKRLAGI